jgi:peptidoglycan hydrolase CwlO-like protein
MEAALSYSHDLEELHKKRKELNTEVKSLTKQVKEMKSELGIKEESNEDSRYSLLRTVEFGDDHEV